MRLPRWLQAPPRPRPQWGGRAAPWRGRRARGDVERVFYGNKFGGTDPITKKRIGPNQGVSVKREGFSRWQVYDKDPSDWPDFLLDYVENDPRAPGNYRKGGAPKEAEAEAKYLHADGTLDFPYDPNAIPIIKTAPGRRWDGQRRKWILSVQPRDLPRTIEVARKIGAQIDPALLGGVAGAEGMTGVSTGGAKALEGVLRSAKRVKTKEGFRPYPYQLQGVEFLARRSHLSDERGACALLADDMGTGKTVQTLLALPGKAQAIVVVPDVVKLNWAIEAQRWRPDLAVTVISKPKEYLSRLPRPGEIIVLNYDRLPGIQKNKRTNWQPEPAGRGAKREAGEQILAEMHSWQARLGKNERGYPKRLPIFLIADEAHKIKNPKAQRTQSFRTLADFAATIWLLTGTPLDNKPPDLWGIMSAGRCAQEAFGWGKHGFTNFKKLFNARDGRYGIEWGYPKPEVAEILRRVMLRRTKEQVLPELPEKRFETVVVVPEPKDWNKIESELDRLYAMLADDIESGELPPFESMSTVRRMLAESRVPAVLELVEEYEEAGKPVVVASAHRAPLLALAERPGWAAIMGGTSGPEKQRLKDEFQAGNLKGIAISIDAGGLGITLTASDTMIFVDQAWKPGDNRQTQDRLHRIGQKSSPLYRIMVSPHPLDQHINRILHNKTQVVHAAIEQRMEYTPPPPPPRGASTEAKATWGNIQQAIKDARAGKARRKLGAKLRQMEGKGFESVSLTHEQTVVMDDALKQLSSVCDWALTKDQCGFNKPDAYTGNLLAMVGLSDPVAQQVAYGILYKYKRQLGRETWGNIYQPEGQSAWGRRSVARRRYPSGPGPYGPGIPPRQGWRW